MLSWMELYKTPSIYQCFFTALSKEKIFFYNKIKIIIIIIIIIIQNGNKMIQNDNKTNMNKNIIIYNKTKQM